MYIINHIEGLVYFIVGPAYNMLANIAPWGKIISEAAISGADFVKFQTFKADTLVLKIAKKAASGV